MKKEKSILLLGSYGQDNLGDDILMENFIVFLFNFNNNLIINTSERENIPEKIKSSVRVVETYKTSLKEWISIIITSKVIIYGGGTIYKELQKSTGRKRYSVIIRMAIFNIIARILHTPVLNFNVGIGYLDSFWGRIISKTSLIFSDFTIFRDKESYIFAKNILKINPKKIYQGNDGLFLQKKWNNPKKIPLKIKTIGLNLLSTIPNNVSREKYVKEMIVFIKYLIISGFKIKYISFQTSFNKDNDVYFFEKYFLKNLPSNSVEVIKDVNTDNVIDIFNDIDILVGMRFHSLILSVATTTPFMAIDYDSKCFNFLKENNYPYKVEISKASSEELILIFNFFKNNIKDSFLKIKNINNKLFKNNNDLEIIKNIINKYI